MIEVKKIPNYMTDEGRESKQVDFVSGKSVSHYVKSAGYDIDEDYRIIVSGAAVDLDFIPKNGDQIIMLNKINDPITQAIWFVVSAIVNFAVTHPYIFTAAVLSTGYAIYSYMNQPSMPNFNSSMPFAGAGGGGGIDDGSNTYGWDGVKTGQDVGIPVPIVYGEHRVGGNIINQFITTDGDKNYLNILLALCEGEIEAINTIKINDNPVDNFTGISSDYRYGTNDQTVIPNFEDLHNVYSVSQNLTQSSPYTYTSQDSDVEGFDVKLTLPAGLFSQDSENGDINSWSVSIRIEYRINGSGDPWTEWGTKTISDKTRTQLYRTYSIRGLSANKYDVRVTKTSADSGFYQTGDVKLDTIDEIKTDDLAYPKTALLGLQLLATDQLSGATPNITCLVKGRKVSAPKIMNGAVQVDWENYYWDNDTSQYKLLSDDTVLSWDGETYDDQYCGNPIWCMKDLMTNNVYGLGEFINTNNFDDDELLEMSRHCEEKVPDGDGGYEKKYRLDIVLDSATRALDLIVQICATFGAVPVYTAGALSLRIDKEETPTQLFTMGNIIKDSFSQTWKTIREVPNVIEVQFADKDKDYKLESVSVIDEDALNSGQALRKQNIRVHTTRLSYALRAGRYALKVAKYIGRTVSFKAGIDAVACRAYDLISVSHDVPQWGYSGRVKTGSTTTLVKLDREVIIEAGNTYKIQVRFDDDTIEERTVTDSAGTYTEVSVSSAFSQAPTAFDVYAFGQTSSVKKDFRVISMRRNNDNEVEISALEYNSNVYDDSAVTLPTNNYSSLLASVPDVTSLELTERIVKLKDGTIENVIDVWFDTPDIKTYYPQQYLKSKIYVSDNSGSSWQYRGETYGKSFSIQGGIKDLVTYRVTVVSVSRDGIQNAIVSSPYDDISIVGKSEPPSDVTGFSVSVAKDHIAFRWDKVTDIDLKGYEIRALPFDGAGWDLGTVVSNNVTEAIFDLFTFTTGQKYFGIKAIDTSGNYSTNQTTAELNIESLEGLNVIETETFDLKQGTLSGDAERGYVEGYSQTAFKIGLILMTSTQWDDGSVWDDSSKKWDLSDATKEGQYITEVKDLGDVFDVDITLDVGVKNVAGGKLTIQIAYSDTDPTPSSWQNFVAGTYSSARYVRFKIIFSVTGSYFLEINRLYASFDVPDKTQEAKGVSVDSGGTTINLTGFTEISTLIVVPVTNAYVAQVDQSNFPDSFTVTLKDPADSMNAKSGLINYYAKGY